MSDAATIYAKVYLGDSVYVCFDGFAFVLTTENGLGPSNTIVLELETYEALVAHVEKVTGAVAAARAVSR